MKARSLLASEVFKNAKLGGFPAVVWKNLSSIDELDSDSFQVELDVFVERVSFSDFSHLLSELGFLKFTSAVASFPGVYHFFAPCEEGWLHLNLYIDFITGESQTKFYNLPFTVAWDETMMMKGIPILSGSDFVELFVIRIAIKSGSFFSLLRTFLDIDDYRSEYAFACGFKMQRSQLLDRKVIESLMYDFHSRKYISIAFRSLFIRFKLSRFVRFLFIKRLVIRYSTVVFRAFNKILFKRKRYRSGTTGLVVSVVGTDGSGKTTVVNFLRSHFSIFDFSVLSIGRQDGYKRFLKPLLLMFGIRSSNKFTSTKSIGRTSFWKAIKALAIARARFKAMKHAASLREKGYLVLLDRLPVTVKGAQDGPRIIGGSPILDFLEGLERRYYEACYLPDVVLVLNVSLENAILRNRGRIKSEKETDYEISARHKLFEQSHFRGKQVNFINANDSIGKVKFECLANILKVL